MRNSFALIAAMGWREARLCLAPGAAGWQVSLLPMPSVCSWAVAQFPLQQAEQRRCCLLPQPGVRHGSAWRLVQQAEKRRCCLLPLPSVCSWAVAQSRHTLELEILIPNGIISIIGIIIGIAIRGVKRWPLLIT